MHFDIFNDNRIYLKNNLDFTDKIVDIYSNYFNYGIKNKYHTKSITFFLLPLFYTIGIIVYYLISSFIPKKNKAPNVKYSFYFITTYDEIIRCANIKSITDEDFLIIYLPSFNLKQVIRHIKFHRKIKESNTYYPSYPIKCIIEIWKFYKMSIKNEKRGLINIKNVDKKQIDFFYKLLFQHLLITQLFKKLYCTNEICKTNKWLLDYDKSIFIPLIYNMKIKGIKTYHFQHGIFIEPNSFYFPLYSDFVLCCSERERIHYIKSGVKHDKIYVIGAPLQSIYITPIINDIKYDLLVLLTSTIDSYYLEEQQIFILSLSVNYPKLKVLLRFRPSSKHYDAKQLKDYINPFSISNKESLYQDISASKLVLSFSVDSVFPIMQLGKPFILIERNVNREITPPTICVYNSVSSNLFIKCFDQMLQSNEMNKINKEEFEYYFGVYNLSQIRDNFKKFLKA